MEKEVLVRYFFLLSKREVKGWQMAPPIMSLPWNHRGAMGSFKHNDSSTEWWVCVWTHMALVVFTRLLWSLFSSIMLSRLCNAIEWGQKKSLTCPSSSKAMTTTAAPNFLIFLAFSKKSSSPSFRLMLLTMHFPWQHFKPASITAKLEESMHRGT